MAEKSPTQPKPRPLKLKGEPEGPKPSVIKQTLTFVIGNAYQIISSTTGIVIIFVIYTFLGAFLFRVIEGGHEYHHKKEIAKVGWDIMETMWNSSSAVKQNEAAFKLLLKRELKKYERKLLVSFFYHFIVHGDYQSIYNKCVLIQSYSNSTYCAVNLII